MKKSIYNYIEDYKGKYIVYNGLCSTCVVLGEDEFLRFTNMNCSDTDAAEFLRLGLYVDDDYNEVDAVFYSSRYLTDKDKRQFYRIYTTLGCNAKCPYCYQTTTDSSKVISMDDMTADVVSTFIIDRMVNDTTLIIEWFGGEPLLNTKAIKYICNKLQSICQERNVFFQSRMVSNGLLFNKQLIFDAVHCWHLSQVQITLDGLKERYETIKGFRKKDSFEQVIENIKMLLSNSIRVSIRLNYDDDKISETLQLVDFLGNQLSCFSNVNVYCRRIMRKNLDNSLPASEDGDVLILRRILNNGFVKNVIDTIPRRDNMCVAHMLHAFMILPDGKVGKCSQAISDGDIIGDVRTGILDKRMVRWCSPRLPNKCIECKLLPICNGGCLYERFENKNYCFASEKVIRYKLLYYMQTLLDSK